MRILDVTVNFNTEIEQFNKRCEIKCELVVYRVERGSRGGWADVWKIFRLSQSVILSGFI